MNIHNKESMYIFLRIYHINKKLTFSVNYKESHIQEKEFLMMREIEYLYANGRDKCFVGQKIAICLNGKQFFLFFRMIVIL